jgi:CRP/FNR family cyclic AMP-dependent transcriptional regulator
MDPRQTLKSTPFFSEVLDDKELNLLAAHAHFVSYPKGATPSEEDAPGHAMFVVVSGEAEVTVMGDKTPVARLRAGDIFGEMSLLTGARRSATVTAVTPLETIEVSKQALAHVLEHSPDLVDRFVQMLSRRQAELDHAAGGNAWGMLRLGRGELASMIRSFFGSAH